MQDSQPSPSSKGRIGHWEKSRLESSEIESVPMESQKSFCCRAMAGDRHQHPAKSLSMEKEEEKKREESRRHGLGDGTANR